MQILLRAGADVNLEGPYGTALQFASNGEERMVYTECELRSLGRIEKILTLYEACVEETAGV